jgi:hypothetical protein
MQKSMPPALPYFFHYFLPLAYFFHYAKGLLFCQRQNPLGGSFAFLHFCQRRNEKSSPCDKKKLGHKNLITANSFDNAVIKVLAF